MTATATKSKGMLFRPELIRALLNTRPGVWPAQPIDPALAFKWQTRRIIKDDWWRCLDSEDEDDRARAVTMAPHPVGSIVYAKEACCRYGLRTIYRADYGKFTPISDGFGGPWKSPIHMCRDEARLWFEVKAVRVERVQSISDADAIAEGVETERQHYGDHSLPETYLGSTPYHRYDGAACSTPSAAESFRTLYESIGNWKENPWCWVYELARLEGPPC